MSICRTVHTKYRKIIMLYWWKWKFRISNYAWVTQFLIFTACLEYWRFHQYAFRFLPYNIWTSSSNLIVLQFCLQLTTYLFGIFAYISPLIINENDTRDSPVRKRYAVLLTKCSRIIKILFRNEVQEANGGVLLKNWRIVYLKQGTIPGSPKLLIN